MMEPAADNVFSQITPAGRGAVASLACHGPGVLAIVDRCLDTDDRPSLKQRPWGALTYGRWQTMAGPGEDLVVVAHDKQNVEIHCHGGSATVEQISTVLSQHGFRLVVPLDFDHGKFQSLWRAEINICLGRSMTRRTAEILVNQQALLPGWMGDLRRAIVLGDWIVAIQQIDDILAWEKYGRHLTEPRSVVLCGQPNVGKSSLINRIAGFERVIVDPTPGTTRDVVTQLTAVDGWPVQLMDTAGLRDNALDPIESEGIRKAQVLMEQADCVVGVFDASQLWSASDQQLAENTTVDLLVFNKQDIAVTCKRPSGASVSAISGDGIADFLGQLIQRLIPEHPSQEQPLICLSEQAARLRACREALLRKETELALESLEA